MGTDSIKTKIAALLAKAKSTEFEHEAEAFMAKVLELLEKYQIDLGDLLDEDDRVVWDQGISGTPSSPSWHRLLYAALGEFYGCRSVRELRIDATGRRIIRQTLVGRESAIVTTNEMFPWLLREINKLGREQVRGAGLDPRGAAAQARRIGNAMVFRLNRLRPRPEQARTEAARKNALMTLDSVEVVLKDRYPDLRNTKGRAINTNAMARDAAEGIALHRQAGAGEGTRALGRGK